MLLDDLREADGIEPDVRVDSPPRASSERPSRLGDGVLDRRLEAAAEVDDEVGVPDRLDVAGRELDVVRLRRPAA